MSLLESEIPSIESMSPTQRARRAAVVDAALDMIVRDGTGVEIRDICQRSGVALGTVYRYFGSKDVLFAEAYLTWRLQHLDDFVAAAASRRTNSSRVRAALHAGVDLFVDRPQFLELATQMRSSRNPDIIQKRHALEERTFGLFKSMLTDVSPKDADAIVFLVHAAFHLAIAQFGAGDRTREEVHEVIDEAMRLVFA